MQLSKTHKEQIVNAILKDVPEVDYSKLIREYLQAEAVKLMPPEVRAVYDNVELRRFLGSVQTSVSAPHYSAYDVIFFCGDSDHPVTYSPTLYLSKPSWNNRLSPLVKTFMDNVTVHVTELAVKAGEQAKARDSMRQKLQTMLAGIRTLKQAKTLLEPELHKYLPVEPPKDPAQKALQASTAVVPYVVANLREMGWPKDQEPKADADTEEVM